MDTIRSGRVIEWVNDPVTTLMRTRGVLRSGANARLDAIADAVPTSINRVRVEYDISYEPHDGVIHGYKFTDLLTQALWLQPCRTAAGMQGCHHAIDAGPTAEGRRIADAVRAGLRDKYALFDAGEDAPGGVVVLPGSNLLACGIVDDAAVQAAVADGAVVKPHPLTNAIDMVRLRKRYGGDVVLPADVALYPLLRSAPRVWACTSSEAGLAAVLMGVPLTLINLPVEWTPTYTALYEALCMHTCPLGLADRMAALFSHASSGLVTVYDPDPAARVAEFAAFYAGHRHGP